MTIFRSIAGAAVLAVALAGAGLSHAKTLTMAYDADPVSLDPHEQLSGGTLQLSHMLFDPLVRWTKDLGFEGRIAESCKVPRQSDAPVCLSRVDNFEPAADGMRWFRAVRCNTFEVAICARPGGPNNPTNPQ